MYSQAFIDRFKYQIMETLALGIDRPLIGDFPRWEVDHKMLTESIKRSMEGFAEEAGVELMDPLLFQKFVEFNQYMPPRYSAFSKALCGKPGADLWFPGKYVGATSFDEYGPRHQTDVMLIGSYPTGIDCGERDTFASFYDETLSPKIAEYIGEAYFTYFIKFDAGITTNLIPKQYKQDCMPWLDHELQVIKPKYIVCFGVDVAKALTGDASITQNAAIGRYYDFTYKGHSCKIAVVPKLQVLCNNRDSERYLSVSNNQLKRIGERLRNPDGINNATDGHIIIRSDTQLKHEVDRIIKLGKTDPKRRVIALDMEWEGEYPEQTGAHLLTVQFSSAPGEAAVVVLKSSDPNGSVVSKSAAKKQLTRLLCFSDDWKPRLGGHFLRADLPWLMSLIGRTEPGKPGPELSYAACKNFDDVKERGGWDTSLMYHAYDEDSDYGLKYLAKHLLGLPAWEAPLQEYLDNYRSTNKLRKKDITGYGCVPDEILHPYAAWDADATRQLAELCMFGYNGHTALLDDDGYGNSSWYPFWMAHRASLGFLEIEQTGFVLDRPRFAELCETFEEVSTALLAAFRDRVNWPDFTPSKILHKRGVLFGHRYAIPLGRDESVMPEEARSLGCEPEYDTKDKRAWDGEEGKDPAADKTTLNILAREHPEVGLLRDIGIIQHALSSPLSNIEHYWDTKGEHKLFPKGLYGAIHEDGKIHTRMSQLMVTGRASSSTPNLQNLGKSAEAAFQRILGVEKDGEYVGDYLDILGGPRYIRPLRSVLRAEEDCVLIESDFTGAELAVMAWASKDPNMIDQVRRNALPEDDPDFYDIHSHVAVKAFRLHCEPTKKGLASIGKKHLRIAAKAVVFGIPYGRGAKAIALQCRADGVDITTEEAQGIMDTYFSQYPNVKEWLNARKQDVIEKHYVETLWHRYRRFKELKGGDTAPNNSLLAAEQREACNAPIQGTVADSVNNAISKLVGYKLRHPWCRFNIAMQIHDSLILQVHKEDASFVYNKLFPYVMVESNPIITEGPDGLMHEYRFGADREVSIWWGEPLTDFTCQAELGMDVNELLGEKDYSKYGKLE